MAPQVALPPATLIMLGIFLAACSGVPGLILQRGTGQGQKIATLSLLAGALSASLGAIEIIRTNLTEVYQSDWRLPFGAGELGVDPLSALFLLVIFLIAACSAVYAHGYWPAAKNPCTERRLSLCFGLLTASLALLVLARDAITFLMAWEVMAISCYFAMTVESQRMEVRDAGTLYMVATHTATLALFAMFALLQAQTGTFSFPAAHSLNSQTVVATAIFITACIGFGLKAGLMPLHIWLPSAHASAPTHVSALMSAVLIKTGIYGMIRLLTFFQLPPLWWGITLLVAGCISAVLGVAFALGQHDLKRLLAYHSIENVGIITIGLGVALIGHATGNIPVTILGIGGSLLHVVNHALFKSLLFLGAGSVIHATGTREIDALGGLARPMPFTAFYFLLGAAAICGLPPLNGFVSEYLIYLGLFGGITGGKGAAVPFMALAAPALALVGGLAVACFIKVYGAAFLGLPRTPAPLKTHEGTWQMLTPMGLLAICCLIIGLFPSSLAGYLLSAVAVVTPTAASGSRAFLTFAPLGWISVLGAVVLSLTLLLTGLFSLIRRSSPYCERVTWDCGYLQPTPRTQYTASSFAEMLVKLLAGVLRPRCEQPRLKAIFSGPSSFASHLPEALLDLVLTPFFRSIDERFSLLRRVQHGQLHLYVFYVFATLVALLVWSI